MTKYVLSIDGGGVRGLASANFLSKLDKKIPKKLYFLKINRSFYIQI